MGNWRLTTISFFILCFFLPLKAGLNGLNNPLTQLINSLQILERELSPAHLSMQELKARIAALKNPNSYQEYDQLANLMLDYLRRTVLEKEGVYDEQFLKSTLSQAARDILDQYNNYQLNTMLKLGSAKSPTSLSTYIKTVNTTQQNEKLVKSIVQQYIEGTIKPLASFFNVLLNGTQQTLNEIIKRYADVVRNAALNDQVKEFDIMQLTNLLKIVINYAYATGTLSSLSLTQEPFKSALKWSLEDEIEALYKLRSTIGPVQEEPASTQAQEFKEEQEKIQKIQEAHEEAYKDVMEQWKEKLKEVGEHEGPEQPSSDEDEDPDKWK